MKLPLGFGELDFTDWMRGCASAFIGGGASAVTSGFVVSMKDPEHFTMGTMNFFQLVGAVFIMAGALGFFAYLAKNPLPAVKAITATVKTTEVSGKPTVTETTVEEKHVEPIVTDGK